MSHYATYLGVRKVLGISPAIQISIIVLLYILSVYFGYSVFQKTGLTQWGVPLHSFIYFAPIYEEILFRGYILGTVEKKYGATWAIIISSLLFGLRHMRNVFYLGREGMIGQVVYTMFIIGPLLGYITLKTKTIRPAVIIHYLNNLLAPFVVLSVISSYLF